MIYALSLFIVIRFLWAPIVERVEFGKIGHYKGWISLTQIFVILVLLATSFCSLEKHLGLIIALASLLSFVVSTQFIALDGFIYKTLTKENRTSANAVKMAGQYLGLLIDGGGGLVFYAHYGWQDTLLVFVLMSLLATVFLFFVKEEEQTKNKNEKPIGLKDMITYWKDSSRRLWLFIVILTPIAMSVFFGLGSRILVDIGWKLDKIGIVVDIIGYSVSVIFAFLSPLIIAKFGQRKVLFFSILGQILGLGLLSLIPLGFRNDIFVIGVILFSYIFYPQTATIITTLMMNKIKSNTPAFEYSIQHGLFAFAGMFSVGFSMFLAGFIGYTITIYITIFITLLALILVRKLEI